MKFSPKCRSKKLGMTYIILGSFCSFFIWEGADVQPKNHALENPCVMWWLICFFFLKVDSQVDLSVSLYAGEFCYVVDHNAGIFLCSRGLKFSLCPNGN